MLTLNSVMIGSAQPEVMSSFYENIFGKKPDMQEGKWSAWKVGTGYVSVGSHSSVTGEAQEPARVMFNLETDEVQKEFSRMKEAGATAIKEPYEMEGMWIATLADPDGNYFQLMSPWEDMK